ncbi:iron-hydroxamate ABC transporter substrate-binding protein [Cohnella cellulosilytica]|uniref:Iron-hydroxamate ABC transporter substrate-binding protein n=1 Tax=Cohnella cellulosilytica TaxID=986710 RepID=A0ABW2FGJ5_9BACL
MPHRFVTSRKMTIIAVILCLAFLAACGSNNAAPAASQPPASESAGPSASESPSAEPEYRTIDTVNGPVQIPAHPQRIVAEEYLGSLIALDVIPVGAPGLSLQNYYFKEALAGVADSGTYGSPSPEVIMSLNPDLIITGNKDVYETLSKIAPTVAVPYGELKNAHEELTFFGKMLGKEKEAQAWLEEYDRQIAEAKAKVDAAIPADASFSILESAGKSIWAYGDNFGRGGQPVYQALGRKPPVTVAEQIMEKQWAEISPETIDEYAGDYIVLTSNDRTLEDFQKDPIWSSIPAVKNDRLYVWPEERSWYYDPIAVLAQTKELVAWLTQERSP